MFYFLKSAGNQWNFRVRDNAIKDVLSYYQKGQIDRQNILSFAPFKVLEITLTNTNEYRLNPGQNYNLYIVDNNIEFIFREDQYIPRWFKAPNITISTNTLTDIYLTNNNNDHLINDTSDIDIFEIAPFETVIDHYTAEKNYKKEYEPEIINFEELEEEEEEV